MTPESTRSQLSRTCFREHIGSFVKHAIPTHVRCSLCSRSPCLNFLLQLDNKIKYKCHFENTFDAKCEIPNCQEWHCPAGKRAEVQPWIMRLTGSDWVEVCKTLETTFIKNTVQASSFFTHINTVMRRSGTRLDLGCIAVDFCLCIDLHWVWFQ